VSGILAIYDALAAKTVTVNGITPAAYDLDHLPNAVESGHLPCRLLTPMAPRAEARDFGFVALGTTAKLTWHLYDLMLWRESGSGTGPQDIAEILVAYAGAYAEMLRSNRSMGQTQAHIMNVRFSYGVFEWPEGSGRLYDGVAVELDIEEILSG
jgi:hypothetical protein